MERRALILAGLLLASSQAFAHQGGLTGYVDLEVRDNALRHRLTLSQLPPAVLAAAGGDLAAALARVREGLATGLQASNAGEACAVAGVRVEAPSSDKQSVVVETDMVCSQAITRLGLEDRSFAVLGRDLHSLARITWPGGEARFAFAPETPRLELDIAVPQASMPGFGSFVAMGLAHLLAGYDHLLFLLALLLVPAGVWGVVRIVTAFTLAHSLTLALVALEVMTLPARLVEIAIAMSIALVAGANAWRPGGGGWRASAAGVLGLIHGCGFADLLLETGLPTGQRVGALLGFNLGVELGQLLVVLAALPALGWIRRQGFGPRLCRSASLVLCATGLGLAAARAFS